MRTASSSSHALRSRIIGALRQRIARAASAWRSCSTCRKGDRCCSGTAARRRTPCRTGARGLRLPSAHGVLAGRGARDRSAPGLPGQARGRARRNGQPAFPQVHDVTPTWPFSATPSAARRRGRWARISRAWAIGTSPSSRPSTYRVVRQPPGQPAGLLPRPRPRLSRAAYTLTWLSTSLRGRGQQRLDAMYQALEKAKKGWKEEFPPLNGIMEKLRPPHAVRGVARMGCWSRLCPP